ncbi:DUF6461 domain-containing protein [Streptomyces longispororuber]|uniref:DUF6461 domain-containing protein n=1 Tax=Streptomyces longispororuber TaxID=68230 RepID=UPI0036FD5E34
MRGAEEDAVIRLFGGDPAHAHPMNLEDMRDHYDDRHLILVSRSGPAVVVVEDNGYQGSREEVLRPLSRLGRTASAYWNVNAVSSLSLAENGLLSSVLDMVVPDNAYGARPDAWQPLLHGLDLEDSDGWGTGLAAVERATGAQLNQAWVQGPHRAVEITPVPAYLLGQGLIHSPLLKREPFLTYLAGLGPSTLQRMRRHALDLALAHADLREHPLAIAALSADALPAPIHLASAAVGRRHTVPRPNRCSVVETGRPAVMEPGPVPAELVLPRAAGVRLRGRAAGRTAPTARRSSCAFRRQPAGTERRRVQEMVCRPGGCVSPFGLDRQLITGSRSMSTCRRPHGDLPER